LGAASFLCAQEKSANEHLPGLVQAKFSNVTFEELCAADVLSAPGAERVLGTLMADFQVWDQDNAPRSININPLTGNGWTWGIKNSGFAYAGQMHVREGSTYTFGKSFDDAARIMVDGKVVLENAISHEWASGTYAAMETGWVDFDVRIWDGGAFKGPVGDDHRGWGRGMGLAFNHAGQEEMFPLDVWQRLVDKGNGSLFRAPVFDAVPAATIPKGGVVVAVFDGAGSREVSRAEISFQHPHPVKWEAVALENGQRLAVIFSFEDMFPGGVFTVGGDAGGRVSVALLDAEGTQPMWGGELKPRQAEPVKVGGAMLENGRRLAVVFSLEDASAGGAITFVPEDFSIQ